MTDPLPPIAAAFTCDVDCPRCFGSGIVCGEHPDKAWGDGDRCCGAAGMPCRPEARSMTGVMRDDA